MQMGANVKRIRNGLYLMAVIAVLFFPMQVFAAGEDAVSLVQEGEGVALVLEMSNAQQEKISAVAISLQIDEESRDKVNVGFDFAEELAGAAEGAFYNESTGVLDIYAASSQSIFESELLNLGHVRVTLKDSGETLPVKISYLSGSFQTANESYGEKKPMVASDPDPINMQVGEGDSKGDDAGNSTGPEPTSTPGNSGDVTDKPQDNSGGSNSDGGNVNEGLYDDNTQFVNDPDSAEKITSSVIRKSNLDTSLVDMSRRTTAAGGGVRPAGNSGKQIRSEGKVTVVSPENGPSSIFVAKDDDNTSGETKDEETSDAILDETEDNLAGEEEGAQGEEILLDRKNGGAESSDSGKRSRVLIWVGIAIVLLGGLGLGIFAFVKSKGVLALSKKKKPNKKKKKKPAPKKK